MELAPAPHPPPAAAPDWRAPLIDLLEDQRAGPYRPHYENAFKV